MPSDIDTLYKLAIQKAKEKGVRFQNPNQVKELLEVIISFGDNEFRTHETYKPLEKALSFKDLAHPKDSVKRLIKNFNKGKIINVSRVLDKKTTGKLKRSSKHGKPKPLSDEEKVIKYYRVSKEFLVRIKPVLPQPKTTSALDRLVHFQNALLEDTGKYWLGGTQYRGATYVFESNHIYLEATGLLRRMDKNYPRRVTPSCKSEVDQVKSDLVTIRNYALKLEKAFNDFLETGQLTPKIWGWINLIEVCISRLCDKFERGRCMHGLFSDF